MYVPNFKVIFYNLIVFWELSYVAYALMHLLSGNFHVVIHL